MTKVVNLKRNRYDIYIGRPGIWGNPFLVGVHGDRDEVIEKYKDWITLSPDAAHLRKKLRSLEGCILGCHCKPLPCHGDVLIELINNLEW